MQVEVSVDAMRAILLTQTLIRIGEAQNPGPVQQPGLTLGAINPTGLMRKATSFSQLPSESNVIWGICETHLTAIGSRKFKSELKFANNNLILHHGAHAPHRSQAITAIGGTHVGTAFVTNLPSRKLPVPCPSEVWDQARCTFSTFLCNNVWIHGAVMYGFAHRAYSVEVRAATDTLLSHAHTADCHEPPWTKVHHGRFQPRKWTSSAASNLGENGLAGSAVTSTGTVR